MNKKSERDQLLQELTVMPEVAGELEFSGEKEAVVLARVLKGVSCDSWARASKNSSLKNWHALPANLPDTNDGDRDLLASQPETFPVSPFREVAGALTRSMFLELLRRELLRLSRNGGNLSIVAATLANRAETEKNLGTEIVNKLDGLLGNTLLSRLDGCDGLGLTRAGVFACSLPGLGQLAARNFAEKASKAFMRAAEPFFDKNINTPAIDHGCAIGIVNIMQGENTTAENLLSRARSALETAMRKAGPQIHQESAFTPFEGTTLVHSSEKRFLFFGGDPQ